MDNFPDSFHIGRVTALLFDTLRLSRTLRDKGHFTPEQAETLAEALGEAAQGDLATKADLAAQELGLKKDIAALRAELKEEIAALRAELRENIAGLRAELRENIAGLRAELKENIAGLRAELKTDNAELRTELKAEIAGFKTELAEVKADILKWMVGAIGFQTVVILGALISLAKIFAK